MIITPEQPFPDFDKSKCLCDGLVMMHMPASYDEDEMPLRQLDFEHARDLMAVRYCQETYH